MISRLTRRAWLAAAASPLITSARQRPPFYYTRAPVPLGNPNAPNQIVFDGNSLTAGYGVPLTLSLPAQAVTLLGPDWSCLNFGVNGQTTRHMAADADRQIDRRRDLRATRTVLVAWEIVNDLHHGAPAYEAAGRFAAYCRARQNAGWSVLALTVLPRADADAPADAESRRRLANEFLRAEWRLWADALVDLAAHPRMGAIPLDRALFADGWHLTAAGCALAAQQVAAHVARLPSPSTAPPEPT